MSLSGGHARVRARVAGAWPAPASATASAAAAAIRHALEDWGGVTVDAVDVLVAEVVVPAATSGSGR
ncbi:hypothetical protein [Litorihabitans aurantiacus]|uniref:Asp23/Gls24 family envelope stress response protein n=1 Tax=Litorihabitans aurantiacus TaxID=1930061 RepID=A0AA37XES2_9MICO|nr:hypothetical protein [Litorihabitans aurantiacus]GMA31993.1 hypothetical protein GCM10025875_19850 [Litorihabitans aurantiacus]